MMRQGYLEGMKVVVVGTLAMMEAINVSWENECFQPN